LVNKNYGAVFNQSLNDFPCPVILGKSLPSFGLHRFNKGLRFIPLDDEGFTLRGNKQQLLYKGRNRTHRISILGDKAFEYDCILNREPETNVITLRMEGAESFDFFRQPDCVKEPFLKGSYAVYKKETLLDEGIGKLCHIHRPEVIDARGRRCWGDLSIAGNMLHITIPEKWLAEAKYPVVVDPMVGTAALGSLTFWDNHGQFSGQKLMFGVQIVVNKFLVSDPINGLCTAYFYADDDHCWENGGYPILYSDNGIYPVNRKSMNECFTDFSVNENNPAGWRSANFMTNELISGGTNIWFGVSTEYFWEPRFDYGSICYCEEIGYFGNKILDIYPMTDVDWHFDLKLSMYFNYGPPQNYVRTITQGINLSGSQRVIGTYKRLLGQTAGISMSIKRFPVFIRNIKENIAATINIFKSLFAPARKEINIKSCINGEFTVNGFQTGKIYKGQAALRISVKTFCNLGGIKSAVIKYKKPDGKCGELAAFVKDTENGVISHECMEGEINASGWWAFWAFVTFGDGRTAVGEAAKVYVWEQGK